MINWLHNFNPQALLVSFGPFHIYWYGLFMVSGILIALGTSSILAKYYKIKADTLLDLAFWLIINGLIGARLYDVLLELSYYKSNPLDIFKIWQGGLAIHGAIIAGLITTYFFARKHKISLWTLSALIVPGLALAQAIGRWGNYFNQELFGLPTSLPWGIPISILNRPIAYLDYDYFQKTMDISAISFHKVMQVAKKMDAINEWGSILALSYIAAQRTLVGYNDMADAKSILESIARSFGYIYGREKNVRINTISQSPTKTTAGSAIKGMDGLVDFTDRMSPGKCHCRGMCGFFSCSFLRSE